MKNVVLQICSGCLVKSNESHQNYTQNFADEVVTQLRQIASDIDWQISLTSCQRFCPAGRVTIVNENQLYMSRGMSVDSVVTECLRFSL